MTHQWMVHTAQRPTAGWAHQAAPAAALLWVVFGVGCADDADDGSVACDHGPRLEKRLGLEGGTLSGEPETPFARLRVEVPIGALARTSWVRVYEGSDATPMPLETLVVGTQFEVDVDTTMLQAPLRVALPFDRAAIEDNGEDIYGLQAWLRTEEGWVPATTLYRTEEAIVVRVDQPSSVIVPGIARSMP
ncbi:MAG: hypothetical protein AAFS10_11910 [Myxococcota bacterium]